MAAQSKFHDDGCARLQESLMATGQNHKGYHIDVLCGGSWVKAVPEWSCSVLRDGTLVYSGPARKSEREAHMDGLAWINARLLAGAAGELTDHHSQPNSRERT